MSPASRNLENSIEQFLHQLRRPDTHAPPAHCVNQTPINVLDHSFFQWRRWLEQNAKALKPGSHQVLALDFDQTLVANFLPGIDPHPEPRHYILSLYPERMMPYWKNVFRHPRFWPERSWPTFKRYRFLRNPFSIFIFRPGLLALLHFWKSQGVRLLLVSASARKRMRFVLRRLPILRHLFTGPTGLDVVTGNDLLRAQLQLARAPTFAHLSASQQSQAHMLRQRILQDGARLSYKTPLVIAWALQRSQACLGPMYDVLIDDSKLVQTQLEELELGPKGYLIEGHDFSASATLALAGAVARQDVHNLPPLNFKPADPTQPPTLGVEDPYFFPLEHLDDRPYPACG